MLTMNATDVRKEWSRVVDSVVRDKPQFIKRTRDRMWLSNLETMSEILEVYHFTAERYVEEDDSITLSLNEIELVENASTEKEARRLLAYSIMDYAADYYKDYSYWSSAPNRKAHIPYVFKALIMDDVEELGDSIICQNGKN
ncbi:hypothetical protein ACQRBN_11690 [Bariatricus sp. SGI.154]|uniref:hypothetical protein n=1 Tax=Bariatricus sp. SGI.154 TaxID=3420549 RepID=UPI003D03DB31